MKPIMLSAFAIILLTAPALSQSLPRFDPPAYCKKISDVSGGSSAIYKSCLEMEQDAYNDLKPSWGSLSASKRNYCEEIARFSDSSYSILKSCVEMETDAEDSTPEFKF